MVDSTLNLRSFALTTLIVVLFTSGMLWLNRDNLSPGYARYEKFGISLVYPEIMGLSESGLPGVSPGPGASDSVGLLQLQSFWENKLDIFEIIWLVKERAPTPEAELEALLVGLQQVSVVRKVGEGFEAVLHGEAVWCIDIEVEEPGNTFSGVVGVIYRPSSSTGLSRAYFVAYVTLKGSATEDQMRASLQTYAGDLSV